MRGKVKGEDEIFALFSPSAAQRKKSFWNSSETFGFLNLFLQKKGLSRRRHLRRSRATEGEAVKSKKGRLKKLIVYKPT